MRSGRTPGPVCRDPPPHAGERTRPDGFVAPAPPWQPFTAPGYGKSAPQPADGLYATVQAAGVLRFSPAARTHLGYWVPLIWDAPRRQVRFVPAAAKAPGARRLRG